MNTLSPLCRSTNPKAPLGACDFHLNTVPCSWLIAKCRNLQFSPILQLPSRSKRHRVRLASLRTEFALWTLLSHSLLRFAGRSERVRSASITFCLFRWNSLNSWLPAIDLFVPASAEVGTSSVRPSEADKMGTTIKGYRCGGTVQRRVCCSFCSQVRTIYTEEGSVQDVQVQQQN